MPPLAVADLDHAHGIVGPRWDGLREARIFLTGGTGFVGKWMLATLLEADRRLGLGCKVTVLTRDPDAFLRQVPVLASAPQVTLTVGDVRSLEPDAQKFTHVIHAATDAVTTGRPLDTFDTCVEGTRRILDFAAHTGAREFLLVSSGAIYGRQPPNLQAVPVGFAGGPDTLGTGSAYAEGKRAAEWLAGAYTEEHGIRAKVARCFAFVGPYLPMDRHFAIGNFIRDAMAEQPLVILGDGTPMRSYLHASEMAAWLWATLLEGRAGAAYNVGGAETVSMAELARLVVKIIGSSSAIEVRKQALTGAPIERYIPDVSRTLTELSLPSPLRLEEAIERTVRWLARGDQPQPVA